MLSDGHDRYDRTVATSDVGDQGLVLAITPAGLSSHDARTEGGDHGDFALGFARAVASGTVGFPCDRNIPARPG